MTKCVLDESAPDLENPRLIAEAGRNAVDLGLEAMIAPLGTSLELLDEELRDVREIDGITVDTEAPCVEPGEVEQLAGELGQAVDLLPHPAQELALGRIVEILVQEQLQMAAEREERGSQLMGGVGDELAACMLEPGQAQAHAVERAGQLAELVGARILDRLVELAVRDPLGRPFEVADAAGEEARAAEAEQESGDERDQRGDQNPVLDQVDGRERVLERARDEDDVLRLPTCERLGCLRVLLPAADHDAPRRGQGPRGRRPPRHPSSIPTTVPPPPSSKRSLRCSGPGCDLEDRHAGVRRRGEARSRVALEGGFSDAQRSRPARRPWPPGPSSTPRAGFERWHDEQVDESEDAEDDDEQREAEPGPDRSEPAHGSRSR